jgi:hypothetical protein
MTAAPETCPGCQNAGVDCYHDLADWGLAGLLAATYQETNEPSDDQVSWFLDNANAISADVGPRPWMLQRLDPLRGYDAAFSINGVICVVPEGGKDCPGTAMAVAEWPVGTPSAQPEATPVVELT